MQITSGLQKDGGFDILGIMRRSHLWKILKAAGVPFNESTCDHKKLYSLIEGNSVLDGVVNFDYKAILKQYRNTDEASAVICSLIVENIVEKKRREFKKTAPVGKQKKAAKIEKEIVEEVKDTPSPDFPTTKFKKKEEVKEDTGLDIE